MAGFYILFVFIVFIKLASGQLFANDKCTSAENLPGTCVFMHECKAAIDAYEEKGHHDLVRCGFEGHTEIVCCVKDRARTPPPAKAPSFDNILNSEIPVPRNAKRKYEIECTTITTTLPPPLSDYILGGQDSAKGEFPHMVALGYVREKVGTIAFVCGGSLISPNFVMTAAHCVKLNKRAPVMSPTVARIGTVILEDSSKFNNDTDYDIIDNIVHPNYTATYYDIGLVKLSRPVIYTATAHAACLFNKQDVPAVLTVTGWGVVDFKTRKRSSTLQKLNINVVSKPDCVMQYKNFRVLRRGIVDEMICAGNEKNKDTCQGDSGGPLQAITENDGHFRIVGITSFGHSCGTETAGVYTKVSSYLDWIENIVWA